ncbi:unnamed protein product [Brassica napus]|uniref:TIR domain-containing protein n=2 Tax=Brassica TaxID=3705 RepID=A0A0D3D092_BRAOL|nr:unnamed protein product [Brassica napus]
MSSSITPSTSLRKYDVFLSFRGLDTRRSFISFLYKELVRRNIRTFKDDKDLESGRKISPELERAIEESKFAVVVISANYAASTWCLEELVKIMDVENKDSLTVIPVFHGVDPCHVRRQIGQVAVQLEKHEKREDREKVLSWRQALTNLASISGVCTLKWEDDSMMVDEIAKRISTLIDTTRKPTRTGSNLVGIDAHMKALSRLLDLNSKKNVRVVGIWARGGNGRSALAKFVYRNICQHFESHCFLENVKRISQDRHMSHLRQEVLKRVQVESNSNQKVLLVANEVNELEHFDALAEDFSCFGPGSIVIITTQDKQLLVSAGIKLVYEVELLRFRKVRELFRQLAFRDRAFSAAFESVLYRGTNLAMEWLGCLGVRSDSSDGCCSVQLIDGDGIYNVSGIDHFIKEVKLGECGLSYAVVSIMGPQSSGKKSTLLNSLFGTNFMEMDAFKGRSQTTKGIWLARCAGARRGYSLSHYHFGLVCDIDSVSVVHDIGREQAANKPLLKTVFQTPLENLEPVVTEDIRKIWDSVPKPEAYRVTPRFWGPDI